MLHRELGVSIGIKQINLSFEIQILAWDKTLYVTNGGDSNSPMTHDEKMDCQRPVGLQFFRGAIQLPLQIVRKRLRYVLIKPALDFSSRMDLTYEAINKRRFIVG